MDIPLLVVAIIVVLLVIIFGVLVHSGLLHNITVSTGKPPIQNVTVAYKFGRGHYKNSRHPCCEAADLAPSKRTFGIYYDDPKKVCIVL